MPAAAGPSPAASQAMDRIVTEAQANRAVPTLAPAVVRDSAVLDHRVAGPPLDPDTQSYVRGYLVHAWHGPLREEPRTTGRQHVPLRA